MEATSYLIRDAHENDIPQLSVLITQLGYPCTAEEIRVRYTAITDKPDYRTLVITNGDEVIGMAGVTHGPWYEKNGTYVRLLAFVVSENYRGQGIGKLLIQAVEEWAKEIGANSVVLSSGNRDERIA